MVAGARGLAVAAVGRAMAEEASAAAMAMAVEATVSGDRAVVAVAAVVKAAVVMAMVEEAKEVVAEVGKVAGAGTMAEAQTESLQQCSLVDGLR